MSKLDKVEDKKRRQQILTVIQNDGNLQGSLRGEINLKRLPQKEEVLEESYVICQYCKSYFKRQYLRRHQKRFEFLSKLALKTQILPTMRCDDLSKEILKDVLILA